RSSRRSPRRASSIPPRTTTRITTRRTRCSTASTSPGAGAMRAWTNFGARYGNTRSGFLSADRRVLVLDVLLADTLGLLHLARLLIRLRRGVVRRLLNLAGVDELLRPLVVVLRAGVAAFAFDLVLGVHMGFLFRSPQKMQSACQALA